MHQEVNKAAEVLCTKRKIRRQDFYVSREENKAAEFLCTKRKIRRQDFYASRGK